MRIATYAVAVAAMTSILLALPVEAAKFASQGDVAQFVNTYRKKPQPKKLPDAVRAMSRLGLFEDLEQSGVYVGFIAGVLGSNQLEARTLIKGMFPMSPENHVVVIRAIAYSGLPEWRDLLSEFSDAMPARKVLIQRYLDGDTPTLDAMPIDSARALDTLWGTYIATGSYEPAQRIIGLLAWSQDRSDVDKLVVGSMAKWTLAANAARDDSLLKLLYVEQQTRGEDVTVPLKEVIEAAETYEFAALRKNALAAIDEVKAKGPESERKWAWATQAGQTVLALGCVVAGATGHAEIAAPCVVTGAVSSAALKLWDLNH